MDQDKQILVIQLLQNKTKLKVEMVVQGEDLVFQAVLVILEEQEIHHLLVPHKEIMEVKLLVQMEQDLLAFLEAEAEQLLLVKLVQLQVMILHQQLLE